MSGWVKSGQPSDEVGEVAQSVYPYLTEKDVKKIIIKLRDENNQCWGCGVPVPDNGESHCASCWKNLLSR